MFLVEIGNDVVNNDRNSAPARKKNCFGLNFKSESRSTLVVR